ncbi:outer membrane lipoprotein chaperone LolA [Desulfocurvus sp. DL9XJH121]
MAAACLALCFLLSAGFSHAAEVEAIVSAMQQRYETLKSFSASFEQEMTNAASGETEKRAGVISFRHPGLVRWETKKPENELLVVGEAEVWDYFPDEQAAYKYTVDDVLTSKTVLRFLSGRARLDQDFWVTSMGRDQSWEKLELVPKEAETEMVQAYLWLDPEHALLQKVQVIDFFGNENTVALSGVVLNPDLSDSQFAFTPPPGVDVFDNSSKK